MSLTSLSSGNKETKEGKTEGEDRNGMKYQVQTKNSDYFQCKYPQHNHTLGLVFILCSLISAYY